MQVVGITHHGPDGTETLLGQEYLLSDTNHLVATGHSFGSSSFQSGFSFSTLHGPASTVVGSSTGLEIDLIWDNSARSSANWAAIEFGGNRCGSNLYSDFFLPCRQQEEDVLKKSIELIEKFSGKKPRGYVAPWWEMSASTAELLLQNGFRYDHSQGYNDFVPFYARVGDEWTKIDYSKKASEWMRPMKHGKPIDLVEIGANWYVDDLPPMMFIKKAPNSHGFVNPRDIEQMWRDEFDWVYREMDYAIFPITIHPDVSGRPQVLLMLERLVGHINSHSGVKWMTMEEIAEDFRRRHPFKAK